MNILRKYMLSVISAILALGCGIIYTIHGSTLAEDGTLLEPFFLIPLTYLFALIALLSFVICFIRKQKHQ